MDSLSGAREHFSRVKSGATFSAAGKEFVLQGQIGEGAVGIVRTCIEKATRKRFALKLLAPESKYIDPSSFLEIRARFEDEGRLGQRLDHPNLIRILAFEENSNGDNFASNSKDLIVPDTPFLLMEYGGRYTLEDYIRADKGIPEKSLNFSSEALFIAKEICEALFYLHRRNLIHGDVKPANVFLSSLRSPTVKVGDFGIANWADFKSAITSGALTTTGVKSIGTLKYMSPEHCFNFRDISVKSDMWSLGITLYELFTNQILPDYHHVYLIKQLRMERGTLYGRMYKLGFGTEVTSFTRYENILEEILNSFLGESSRPSSRSMSALLNRAYQDKS